MHLFVTFQGLKLSMLDAKPCVELFVVGFPPFFWCSFYFFCWLHLQRVSSFSASCRGLHLQAIVEGCLRALEEAREARSSAEVKWVALEAAHATSVMLRWPGDHHEVFHNMGVAQIISDLLLERDALTSMKNSAEPSAKLRHNRRPRGTGKGNLMLWPLLWESLGFIAAHYKSPLEKGPLSGKSFHEDILCGLPATAW
jgi:hypothetical protein